MRGHAKAYRREAGSDERSDRGLVLEWHDERQRARPVPLGKRAGRGVERSDTLGCGEVWNMDNQRVEAWSSLGFVDARNRLGVGSVSGEAVDRLGCDRDRLAGEDQPRRLGDRIIREGDDPRFVFR